eukprot:959176-Heterocapsa_arctica.AAC.1
MTMRVDQPVIFFSTEAVANCLSFVFIISWGKPNIQMMAGFASGARVDAIDGAEANDGGAIRRPSIILRLGAGPLESPP